MLTSFAFAFLDVAFTGDPEDVIKTAKPTSDVIKEASKLKADLVKTSETSQWYEAVRAAMEQLSGIKVEGIEAIKKGKSQTGMMVKLLCGREVRNEDRARGGCMDCTCEERKRHI